MGKKFLFTLKYKRANEEKSGKPTLSAEHFI
jgi:hypothetical protein